MDSKKQRELEKSKNFYNDLGNDYLKPIYKKTLSVAEAIRYVMHPQKDNSHQNAAKDIVEARDAITDILNCMISSKPYINLVHINPSIASLTVLLLGCRQAIEEAGSFKNLPDNFKALKLIDHSLIDINTVYQYCTTLYSNAIVCGLLSPEEARNIINKIGLKLQSEN